MWLDSVDSTNSEAFRRAGDLDNMSVVAAIDQTAGKGQRGNVWKTEPGANLTFSILLRFGHGGLPGLKATEQFLISKATTVALSEFFSSRGIHVKIKWPNDIYYRNRKLTGILIENRLEKSDLSLSVVGIGINVNQRDFPPQLLNPVSMALISGHDYDIRTELDDFMDFFGEYAGLIGSVSGRDTLSSLYKERLFRLGEKHDYSDCRSGEVFKAAIRDVAEDGRLIVETEDGAMKMFNFKEISYIL